MVFNENTKVWKVQFSVPEAKALTIVYDKFWLPPGAKLFIYSNDKKHSIGAFTEINNKGNRSNPASFVTGFVKGNNIIVEYYEPLNSKHKGIISIEKLGYVYKNIPFLNVNGYGASLPCNVNINCGEGYSWQNEKRAVAVIANMSDFRFCTGALINNTSNNKESLFLTADHCLSGQDAEGNNNLWDWLFYWNYESPTCNSGVDFIPLSSQGATLLANNPYTDFALLRLNDNLSNIQGFIPYYLGWSRNTEPATKATSIHHPKGDMKKISIDNHKISNYPSTIDWKNAPSSQPNTHWKTIFDIGTTEGGSSGSPLMDQNHRIVGQLQGGPSGSAPITKY